MKRKALLLEFVSTLSLSYARPFRRLLLSQESYASSDNGQAHIALRIQRHQIGSFPLLNRTAIGIEPQETGGIGSSHARNVDFGCTQ